MSENVDGRSITNGHSMWHDRNESLCGTVFCMSAYQNASTKSDCVNFDVSQLAVDKSASL